MTSTPPRTPEELSEAARSLWAKSGDDRARESGAEPWLSLPQHMYDAAGAAGSVWDTWTPQSVKRSTASQLGLTDEDARALITWLAAVHDIGKATLTFQLQLEERPGFESFRDRLENAGLPVRKSVVELGMPRLPHGLASRCIVQDWLRAHGVPTMPAKRLAEIVDAHHGSPSRPQLHRDARAVIEQYALEPRWKAVHAELMDFAATITGILPVLSRLRRPPVGSGQMLVTGHVVMADWIASNAEVFPLTTSGTAADRHVEALAAVGLTAPWSPAPPEIDALDEHVRVRFGWPGSASARPVQRAAVEAAIALDGPGLLIIEAPTGEGKTEAALTAAEILAHRTGAGGVMVAAPTMATADGLFRRVVAWSANAAGQEPLSMFLGHSRSMLNEHFRELPLRRIGEPGNAHAGPRDGEDTVVASQWMSGRKKGILANVSVATVDQVLFMALQAKHSMLRHLGLAGKVVIIDEVHAYDAYMSEYLATALQWLARYGVPVVLLSATLPLAQKGALLEAYHGQVSAVEIGELSTTYPLVTTTGAPGLVQTPIAARRSDLHATVVIIDDDLDALCSVLESALTDGGCVLVICNTVRRAQDAFTRLSAQHPGCVELHHAAFMASDRARKEEELRAKLGPDAHRGRGRPHRRIVVATQVAEQSLDIDVDLLVTDIAPIDLMIQRIGRLHRHQRPVEDRPPSMREPRVLVRGIADPDAPSFERGSEAVYGAKLLMATLAVLRERVLATGFTRPDDIAPLVQSVYGDAPPIPGAWAEDWERACAASDAARAGAIARSGTYRIPAPGAAPDLASLFRNQQENVDTADGEATGLAQVRDSDPSIEVIPIVVTGTGWFRPVHGTNGDDLNPDLAPSDRAAYDLAASTVRLPARFARFDRVADEVIAHLELHTPRGWQESRWLRGQLALPLDADRSITLHDRTLRYDDELGLVDITDAPVPASCVGPTP